MKFLSSWTEEKKNHTNDGQIRSWQHSISFQWNSVLWRENGFYVRNFVLNVCDLHVYASFKIYDHLLWSPLKTNRWGIKNNKRTTKTHIIQNNRFNLAIWFDLVFSQQGLSWTECVWHFIRLLKKEIESHVISCKNMNESAEIGNFLNQITIFFLIKP